MMILVVFAVLAAIAGGFNLLNTFTLAQSAPQQGAGAAMSVAIAVIPYCLVRVIQAHNQNQLLREIRNGLQTGNRPELPTPERDEPLNVIQGGIVIEERH